MTAWTPARAAMLCELGLQAWLPRPARPGEAAVGAGATTPSLRGGDSAGPERQVPARAVEAAAGGPARMSNSGPARVAPAGLDWPELQRAVEDCTACGLCATRTRTVFGIGHRRARWMIVGEAPGEQEDLRGEPFVGRSGQLLDAMLRVLGLTRSADSPARQVYIANTLKCRPPSNRNPEPEELARCEPFLVRQIELVQPAVVLAMGRFAVQALLRSKEPVGRLRGRVHHYQGVPLVVTYHPAYLLRNPLDKARAWEDLCLARQVCGA